MKIGDYVTWGTKDTAYPVVEIHEDVVLLSRCNGYICKTGEKATPYFPNNSRVIELSPHLPSLEVWTPIGRAAKEIQTEADAQSSSVWDLI